MRKLIPIKPFSWILFVAMLTVTIHCVHESAHAMQSHLAAAADRTAHSGSSAPHHCPGHPFEQQTDSNACDTCLNCASHAPLTTQPLQLSYNPSIRNLTTYDPFKHLPEVYIPKFIPPQINV